MGTRSTTPGTTVSESSSPLELQSPAAEFDDDHKSTLSDDTFEHHDKQPVVSVKPTEPEVLSENPFDTEHSRTIFDAIDKFQSCGAGEYLDIPQVRHPSLRVSFGSSCL